MCAESWTQSIVSKNNEYGLDETYIHSCQKNQSEVLFSTNLATWVFLGKMLGVSW